MLHEIGHSALVWYGKGYVIAHSWVGLIGRQASILNNASGVEFSSFEFAGKAGPRMQFMEVGILRDELFYPEAVSMINYSMVCSKDVINMWF